jgi:hypothetical protein
VKPYSKNPRQISEKRLARLRDTLERLGDLSGIVHNLTTDEIIGGHQRMRIFEGASEIIISEEYREPDDQGTVGTGYILWKGKKYIYRQVRWNSKTAAEANIAANLGAGEWDWDKIANEWDASDLKSWGMDFDELRTWKHDLSGLSEMLKSSEEEPVDAEPQIDKAEELNKIWQVNTGDLWKIGEHRLLCGDSTKREDVERVMGGENIDLTLTDPPYGVDFHYESHNDTKENLLELIRLVIEPCIMLSRVMLVTPGNGNQYDYPKPTWTLSWQYHGVGRGPWGFTCWQPVLAYGKDPFLARGMGCRPDSIDKLPNDPDQKELGHSCPKPIGLWSWMLQRGSAIEGDIVYDPFLGSGTTMVACQNLSRKCRGIEISPNYCAVVLQRMQDAFPGIEIKLENGGKMKRKAIGKK